MWKLLGLVLALSSQLVFAEVPTMPLSEEVDKNFDADVKNAVRQLNERREYQNKYGEVRTRGFLDKEGNTNPVSMTYVFPNTEKPIFSNHVMISDDSISFYFPHVECDTSNVSRETRIIIREQPIKVYTGCTYLEEGKGSKLLTVIPATTKGMEYILNQFRDNIHVIVEVLGHKEFYFDTNNFGEAWKKYGNAAL